MSHRQRFDGCKSSKINDIWYRYHSTDRCLSDAMVTTCRTVEAQGISALDRWQQRRVSGRRLSVPRTSNQYYRTRTRTGIAGTSCRASPRPLTNQSVSTFRKLRRASLSRPLRRICHEVCHGFQRPPQGRHSPYGLTLAGYAAVAQFPSLACLAAMPAGHHRRTAAYILQINNLGGSVHNWPMAKLNESLPLPLSSSRAFANQANDLAVLLRRGDFDSSQRRSRSRRDCYAIWPRNHSSHRVGDAVRAW